MIVLLLNSVVQGQIRKGFEGYYYPTNGGGISSLSTKLFYQNSQGWYAEGRYNYEEEGTVACSMGKTFSKENAVTWSLTPELGLAFGRLQGASLGLNTALSCKWLSFNSSLLYTTGFEMKEAGNSFFNWSELNVQITKYLYGGITTQLSTSRHTTISQEPGVQLGVMFRDWAFPLYVFDRPGAHLYLAAGACYEWKK